MIILDILDILPVLDSDSGYCVHDVIWMIAI